jgi:hypothetical protein
MKIRKSEAILPLLVSWIASPDPIGVAMTGTLYYQDDDLRFNGFVLIANRLTINITYFIMLWKWGEPARYPGELLGWQAHTGVAFWFCLTLVFATILFTMEEVFV